MEVIKEFMPYIVSVLTAVISGISSYLLSKRNFKNEVETITMRNEHEIDKLMKQHKVDIENLKEQHKLEMKAKDKEYQHEREMIELKSTALINEKNQEAINKLLVGTVDSLFKDLLSGKITAEDLNNISLQLKNKK